MSGGHDYVVGYQRSGAEMSRSLVLSCVVENHVPRGAADRQVIRRRRWLSGGAQVAPLRTTTNWNESEQRFVDNVIIIIRFRRFLKERWYTILLTFTAISLAQNSKMDFFLKNSFFRRWVLTEAVRKTGPYLRCAIIPPQLITHFVLSSNSSHNTSDILTHRFSDHQPYFVISNFCLSLLPPSTSISISKCSPSSRRNLKYDLPVP